MLTIHDCKLCNTAAVIIIHANYRCKLNVDVHNLYICSDLGCNWCRVYDYQGYSIRLATARIHPFCRRISAERGVTL